MSKTKKTNPRRGSSFGDFLKEEGLYHQVVAHAEKEILASPSKKPSTLKAVET